MTTSSNSGWKGCGTAAVCSIALKMNPNTSYSSQIQSVQPITKCFTRSQKFSLLMNLLVCSLLQEVYSCSACYLPCSEKPRSGRLQINKAGSECSRAPGAAWNQKHTCRAYRPHQQHHTLCAISLSLFAFCKFSLPFWGSWTWTGRRSPFPPSLLWALHSSPPPQTELMHLSNQLQSHFPLRNV